MQPHQLQDLLDKYSRGECTPEEEQLIIDWYHRIGETKSFRFAAAEITQASESIWRAINPASAVRPLWPRILLRVAAVIAPFVVCAFLFVSYYSGLSLFVAPGQPVPEGCAKTERSYRNEGSVPVRVALPDGSAVVLQPASAVRLADNFGDTSRELYLKGEAFFEVSHDKQRPFLVYANEVVTRVLGTSFSVKAYDGDGEITVAVKTGKVSVYTNKDKTKQFIAQGREVVLTPNQQVVYHRFRQVVSKQLVEKPEIILPDSKLFRMQFEDTPVSEIFKVLQENYGVEIRYDANDVKRCRLTTSMSDEGLYERIEVICKAIGASYAISDDAAITITSTGC